MKRFAPYRKALVAGSVVVAELLRVTADGDLTQPEIVTVVLAALGAFGVYRVSNGATA
jgi:hypothetical protein